MDGRKNISGTYGGVVVQDSHDTVFFSGRSQYSSRKAAIVDIGTAALLVAVISAILIVTAPKLALVGMLFGLIWIGVIMDEVSQPTLAFNLPERRWAMEVIFPTQRIISGDTGALRDITMRKVNLDGDTDWLPTLKWMMGPNQLYDGLYPLRFTLGRFRNREHEARAFAEALGSRLGIPAVDEPEPCKEIIKKASNWLRKA